MPRFVILQHDHPVLHWDLMLEADGVLRTWRLPHAPGAGVTMMDALELPDHRLKYLDYEGPVSGNRGMVRRWDLGAFEEAPDSLPDRRKLIFKGVHVYGAFCLERMDGATWRLVQSLS